MLRKFGGRKIAGLVGALALLCSATARSDVVVTNGYLDTFFLNSGPMVDVGALGGGLDSNSSIHQITLNISQGTMERIGGVVRGVFFATGIAQSGGSPPTNAQLDLLFDASNQLIRVTSLPGFTGVFENSSAMGPAPNNQPNTHANPSKNFPPEAGGSGAIWQAPGPDSNPSPTIYDGPILYDFSVSQDGVDEYDPGLQNGNTYVITALVASATGGAVAFGMGPSYSEPFGVFESQDDLFASPFPISGASVGGVPDPNFEATFLTTVAINVVPEPVTLGLVLVGAIAAMRRRAC